jgi:hypothetical protein
VLYTNERFLNTIFIIITIITTMIAMITAVIAVISLFYSASAITDVYVLDVHDFSHV